MKTGIRLFLIRHDMVVEKVSVGVMISEPSGIFKDSIPRKRAEDPEFVYKQYFLESKEEIFFSNFLE